MATKIKKTPSRWMKPLLAGVFVLGMLPLILVFSVLFEHAHLGQSPMTGGKGIEREAFSPLSLGDEVTGVEMMAPREWSQPMMQDIGQTASLPAGSSEGAPAVSDRNIATTASLAARVESVDWSVGKIREIVVARGGYVQSASVNRPAYSEKSAWMNVKIPAADFLGTFDELKTAFTRVTGEHIDASDITAAIYDTQARLRNKQAEEEALQGLLGSTSDVSNILKITDRLSQVRSEIESLEASERTLNEKTSMASVDIQLTEDPQVTADTNNLRSGNVFKVAVNELWRGLIQVGSGLVIVVVAGLPLVLIYLMVLWIIYFFTKKGVKKLFDR